MNTEIETRHEQDWRYDTDVMNGVCIIAKDDMEIKFVFEQVGKSFYDVLKIDAEIKKALEQPVSVEGLADHLHDLFPKMRVTAKGRAASHGWISSTIEACN